MRSATWRLSSRCSSSALRCTNTVANPASAGSSYIDLAATFDLGAGTANVAKRTTVGVVQLGAAMTVDHRRLGELRGQGAPMLAGGPGTPLFSPVVDLAIGMEPGSAVDGDGTNSNGTIDFPLIGRLNVQGRTPSDVADEIQRGRRLPTSGTRTSATTRITTEDVYAQSE